MGKNKGIKITNLPQLRRMNYAKAKTAEERQYWRRPSIAERLGINFNTYCSIEDQHRGTNVENVEKIRKEFPGIKTITWGE